MTLEQAVQRFFYFLNRTEESDGGNLFHPVTISCCRVMWIEELNEVLDKMAELSGAERNQQ